MTQLIVANCPYFRAFFRVVPLKISIVSPQAGSGNIFLTFEAGNYDLETSYYDSSSWSGDAISLVDLESR